MGAAQHVRNPGRAFIRGRPRTVDRQHSWHFVRPECPCVVTEALARLHARDVAQRHARRAGRKTWNAADHALHDATLSRMLALVGEPLEVLFT